MLDTDKQFLRGRLVKLLVPSTLGLYVYHWAGGYLNLRIGGGLAYMPKPLLYPISAISGIGPLWFAQMLFMFSVLLVLIRKLDKKDALWALGGKANIFVVLLLVLPVWGAAQLLNMPLLTMYRFGIYGLTFLLGYFVFSHEEVQVAVQKIHLPMFILAIVLGVCYTMYYFGTDYTAPQCLQGLFTNVYLWVAILAILGCGRAWLEHTNPFLSYLTQRSFGLYVLHYPIALWACALLYFYTDFPMLLNYVLALLATLGLTPLVGALLRRIPVVRFLVLGIRKKSPVQHKASQEKVLPE